MSNIINIYSVITAASNGLHLDTNTIKLGGVLTEATTITASALNTLAIAGLQTGSTADNIVMADPTTGILKKIAGSTYLTTISGIAAGGELSGTYPNPTLVNSAVIGKVLTGYVSGAGTVSATDSILSAIQKLNGNISTFNVMTSLGDMIYGLASGVPARLAGNTTTATKFLTSTGNGTISSAPIYFDLFGTSNTWTGVNTFLNNAVFSRPGFGNIVLGLHTLSYAGLSGNRVEYDQTFYFPSSDKGVLINALVAGNSSGDGILIEKRFDRDHSAFKTTANLQVSGNANANIANFWGASVFEFDVLNPMSTANMQGMYIGDTFAPFNANNDMQYHGIRIASTINQTGATTKATRGIYINPTLTSAVDWRSIETNNNTGWSFYGAGTALSYFGGNISIGTTTNSARMYIKGIGATNATKGIWYEKSTGGQPIFAAYDNGDVFFNGGVTINKNVTVGNKTLDVNGSIGAFHTDGYYGTTSGGVMQYRLYTAGPDVVLDRATGRGLQFLYNGISQGAFDTTGGWSVFGLSGGGTQMVTVNNAGLFGVSAIPTGTVTSTATTGFIPYMSTATNVANSGMFWDGSAVLINTATPISGLLAAKLHVIQSPSVGDYAAAIKGGTTVGDSYGLAVLGGTNSSDVSFKVFDSPGTSTYFMVRGDGNMGFGTTNIFGNYAFVGNGGHPNNNVMVANQSFNNLVSGTLLRLGHGASSGDTYSTIDSLVSGGILAGNIILNQNGGNVGIGKTDALSALDVNGQTRTTHTSGFQLDNAGTMQSKWYQSGTDVIFDRISSTAFVWSQATTPQLTLGTNGNLWQSSATSTVWDASFRLFQQEGHAAWYSSTSSNQTFLIDNVYYNAGLKYFSNGYGTRVTLNSVSGAISFDMADTGLTGAAATLTTRFNVNYDGSMQFTNTAGTKFFAYQNGQAVVLTGSGSGFSGVTYSANNTDTTGYSSFGVTNNLGVTSSLSNHGATYSATTYGAKSLASTSVLEFMNEGIIGYTAASGLSVYTTAGLQVMNFDSSGNSNVLKSLYTNGGIWSQFLISTNESWTYHDGGITRSIKEYSGTELTTGYSQRLQYANAGSANYYDTKVFSASFSTSGLSIASTVLHEYGTTVNTNVVNSGTWNIYMNAALKATFDSTKLTLTTGIQTSNPASGTAATWKLGSKVSATVALVTTDYIEIDIAGVAYKLALVS